jgi:hypothetical protein
MPAVSEKQRRLMMLAATHPERVRPENQSVLRMSLKQLHDFSKLPPKRKPARKG